MKTYFLLFLFIVLSSCGPSKNTSSVDGASLDQSLQNKNRVTTSLLNRIRQMPGVIVRNGVPLINKTSNSLYNQPTQPGSSGGSAEPLYVLNDYIVGNSFRDINQLIDNNNVKEISILTGSDASEYGSRGAKGVIKIITN
jgi:outer membrane receptor protein involved in Fe transport